MPKTRDRATRETAAADTLVTNWSSSAAKGALAAAADEVKLEIYPKTVASPVRKQIPTPFPVTHREPKKATFFASNMS